MVTIFCYGQERNLINLKSIRGIWSLQGQAQLVAVAAAAAAPQGWNCGSRGERRAAAHEREAKRLIRAERPAPVDVQI